MDTGATIEPVCEKRPFYYGWIMLVLAALAMLATLPGRSVGIGLITEPLLHDLELSRLSFGKMNFWATLIGAGFNVLCGLGIDRYGVRFVGTFVLATLGNVVLAFSQIVTGTMLLPLLILMRGFGQSALSVVSLTTIGKWFVRRLSMAMGMFSVLISLGFVFLILVVQSAVGESGWRAPWRSIGYAVLGTALLSALLLRNSPESMGISADHAEVAEAKRSASGETTRSFTLKQSLGSAAFWVFALGSALFNLVIAGVVLFNQSILAELGLDERVYRNAMALYMGVGLLGNVLAGWLARKWPLLRMMSIAMVLVALYLLLFPYVRHPGMALAHAGLLGLAGGVVTVLFFTAWGKTFGRDHLGKIQGAAQIFTVLASATGPWLLASVFEASGSYNPAFYGLSGPILLVAVIGWFVKPPNISATRSPVSG